MTRVKICGIKTREEAQWAVEAGAHALGFVFSPGSRRVDPELAREIILSLPPFVSKVGVFVNEQRYAVEELATFCKLDALQFQGEEPPEYCRRWSYQVIKGFSIGNDWDPRVLAKYQVDAYLLHTPAFVSAGCGEKEFDWNLAREAKDYAKPLILAGDIDPANVKEAIRIVSPFAVDVSSGVEHDGTKSRELIFQLLDEIR